MKVLSVVCLSLFALLTSTRVVAGGDSYFARPLYGNQVRVGQKLWIEQGSTNPQYYDWVGFYQIHAQDNSPRWWFYTQAMPYSLHLPTINVAPGQYEFRYFLAGTYNRVFKSQTIQVNN